MITCPFKRLKIWLSHLLLDFGHLSKVPYGSIHTSFVWKYVSCCLKHLRTVDTRCSDKTTASSGVKWGCHLLLCPYENCCDGKPSLWRCAGNTKLLFSHDVQIGKLFLCALRIKHFIFNERSCFISWPVLLLASTQALSPCCRSERWELKSCSSFSHRN